MFLTIYICTNNLFLLFDNTTGMTHLKITSSRLGARWQRNICYVFLKRKPYRDDPVLLWITLCQFVIKLFFWQCLTTQELCVKRNIEASLLNLSCRGKTNSITYSECVFVCSLSYLAWKEHGPYYIAVYGLSGLTIFSTLSHKRCDFRKKNPWTYRIFVLIFFTIWSEIILILRKTGQDVIIHVQAYRSSWK